MKSLKAASNTLIVLFKGWFRGLGGDKSFKWERKTQEERGEL